jgi:hypothetical protein
MVRTAGSGARPIWAQDYSDQEGDSEEVVSEEEYSPSKKVFILSLFFPFLPNEVF